MRLQRGERQGRSINEPAVNVYNCVIGHLNEFLWECGTATDCFTVRQVFTLLPPVCAHSRAAEMSHLIDLSVSKRFDNLLIVPCHTPKFSGSKFLNVNICGFPQASSRRM